MERLSKWKAIIQTSPQPSTLQYLWAFLFHPMPMLHHLRLFIRFTTWFHLYSLFPSPSSLCSPPFIISTFYSHFFNLLFYLPFSLHPVPPHLSKHTFFCCLLFSSLSPFLLLFFLFLLSSLLGGAIHWTGHIGPLWKRTLINTLRISILRLVTTAYRLHTTCTRMCFSKQNLALSEFDQYPPRP